MRLLAICAVLIPAALGAAETPAPFALGTHRRPVSTRSAEAQKAFDQALAWTFSFNHGDAERAYREAARLDPGLAMAWWGVALVNGPHINNTFMDEAHSKAAWEALQEAQKRKDGASPVEQALIDALAARYAWPPPADRAPLEEAYAKAMAGVFARFPQDADVATLYAESLMDVRPWDQWTKDGQPQPGTQEVLGALEAARLLDPNHPGALHLTIHALEASPQPERAREAADRLRGRVPDAGHMEHMPGHIDVRLGRWAEAEEANVKAIAADERYASRRLDPGFWALYMAHNRHFLAYAAMMQGRRAVALARTREVVEMFPPAYVQENALFADAFMTVHLEALKRFGRWREVLAARPFPAELPVATAYRHYARGVALAALGRLEEAKAELASLRAALPAIPRDAAWGSNTAAAVMAVAVPALAGEIAYRQRSLPTAVSGLQEAVDLEDALKYDEPPPWTVPNRHALGAVLVSARRYAEAEAVYREDLRRYPENGWSLQGLARALEGQGQAAEAAAVKARLRKAWARADVKIDTSCLCVRPDAPARGSVPKK
jgi:tetratricopeptide (TPR) repeat protein